MGIGDEIMVTGEVKRLLAQHARPDARVAIIDERPNWPRHRWHDIWRNNPSIAQPNETYEFTLHNCGGTRPYIVSKTLRFWTWKEYEPEPGAIYLDEKELELAALASGAVIIHPFIKAGASPNKRWPIEHWQALVSRLPRVRWIQIGSGDEPRIPGAQFLQTPTFRAACGVLSGARLAVLQEGGLHHAAAALGIPSIVIFGGFISPAVTGYKQQRNFYVASEQHPLGCGMRAPCYHCHRAMLQIKPWQVAEAIEERLR